MECLEAVSRPWNVGCPSDLLVGRRRFRRAKTKQSLKGCHRMLASIVAEHKLVEVDLELFLAYAMIGSMSHCWRLPIARSASGTTDLVPFRKAVREG